MRIIATQHEYSNGEEYSSTEHRLDVQTLSAFITYLAEQGKSDTQWEICVLPEANFVKLD